MGILMPLRDYLGLHCDELFSSIQKLVTCLNNWYRLTGILKKKKKNQYMKEYRSGQEVPAWIFSRAALGAQPSENTRTVGLEVW